MSDKNQKLKKWFNHKRDFAEGGWNDFCDKNSINDKRVNIIDESQRNI